MRFLSDFYDHHKHKMMRKFPNYCSQLTLFVLHGMPLWIKAHKLWTKRFGVRESKSSVVFVHELRLNTDLRFSMRFMSIYNSNVDPWHGRVSRPKFYLLFFFYFFLSLSVPVSLFSFARLLQIFIRIFSRYALRLA